MSSDLLGIIDGRIFLSTLNFGPSRLNSLLLAACSISFNKRSIPVGVLSSSGTVERSLLARKRFLRLLKEQCLVNAAIKILYSNHLIKISILKQM